MGSFNLTQNGVSFNTVSEISARPSTLPFGPKMYEDANEQATSKKLINCVDMDWNGAALDAAKPSEPTEGFPNSTVNTTGELLKNIANLQAQVDLLTTLVKGLYSALT